MTCMAKGGSLRPKMFLLFPGMSWWVQISIIEFQASEHRSIEYAIFGLQG